ncbi:hypothetical protein ABFS83_07G054400 [Erythranthe nasuta]
MLRTEPSFSIYGADDDKFGVEEPTNEDLIKQKLIENKGIAAAAKTLDSQFSFGRTEMRLIEEDEDEEEVRASNRSEDPKIEIQGGGDEFEPLDSDRDVDPDMYYSKMVRKDPSNPLILRNYAQYLESKRDFAGAEEYYYRATEADPKDGEALSQYAKLVWEIHGDQIRASNYFQRAVQASPQDSNVLAAYASFLWKIDESEDEHLSNTEVDENSDLADVSVADFEDEKRPSSPSMHLAMGLGVNIDGFGDSSNEVSYIGTHLDEDYLKRMVDENPRNPLFLGNYARFLHQSKGDLNGAEEYYTRAILADPENGEMLSLNATIVWQLHRDYDRALAYFERAVEATPQDSDVLAAYAKFLWETEAEEQM